jgi:3-oxoacyl-[acyl-carrier protein] reductase
VGVPAERLAGKVALGTGAGRGFGRAIALAFAGKGARVVANYLGSEAGAREVVAEAGRLGTEAIARRGDVARDDDVRRLIGVTLDHFGRIDILVNNAGVMVRGPLLQVPEAECRRMLDMNVMGVHGDAVRPDLRGERAGERLDGALAPGGIETDRAAT